jgi:hypothetical protein
MNRRGFLKMLGGGAAIGAGAVVAAPLVRTWPFREYFFGLFRRQSVQTFSYVEPAPLTLDEILAANAQFGPLNLAAVQAYELEAFAKGIPDLIYSSKNPIYRLLKTHIREHRDYVESDGRVDILDLSEWEPGEVRMRNGSKIIFEPNIESPYRAEPDLAVSEVLSSLDRDIRRNLDMGKS